jgi:hypothetical protein
VTISKAIDPARVGLSKSLMTTPCERQGYYKETVRDPDGRRLSFPLPERVTFGTAVDEAVGYLVYRDQHGDVDPDWNDEQFADIVGNDARIIGMQAAEAALGWPLVTDPDTFGVQLANAIRLYFTSDDGLDRIRALYPERLRIQGENGHSIKAGDVIGTPDFLTDASVVDVKTWGRNDGIKKFWRSAEMGVYAYLFAAIDGELPKRLAYQAYVRVSKPYWTWLEITDEAEIAALVSMGRETAAHWRGLLELGRPELFPTDVYYCGDCPFRLPMPEVGHDGCAVGRLVPVTEEAE